MSSATLTPEELEGCRERHLDPVKMAETKAWAIANGTGYPGLGKAPPPPTLTPEELLAARKSWYSPEKLAEAKAKAIADGTFPPWLW